jgi:hypothetical protein
MKRRKRKRFAYVIARPLKSVGRLSFLSDGKFPLCHWALLVTNSRPELETDRADSPIEAQSIMHCHLQGTLFELHRSPDGLNPNIIEDFKLEKWCNAWGFAISKYAGETRVSDQNLSNTGEVTSERCSLCIASEILRSHPDYNGYKNNCQNFVVYLLQFACPEYTAPQTIRDFVKNLTPISLLLDASAEKDSQRSTSSLMWPYALTRDHRGESSRSNWPFSSYPILIIDYHESNGELTTYTILVVLFY